MTAQMSLIPDDKPTFDDESIPLDMLPPSDHPVYAGRSGSKESSMAKDIHRYGVIYPVILVACESYDWNGKSYTYRIEDGRHRIVIARELGHKTIPARIFYPGEWDVRSALGLIANEQRSENLYGQLVQVEDLLQQGYSLKSISADLGIDQKRVQYLLQVSNLSPELRAAFAGGQIGKTVALAASKLSDERQIKLIEPLMRTGTVTAEDVRRARQVQREEATTQMSWDLDLKLDERMEDPRANLVKLLQDVIVAGTNENGDVRGEIGSDDILAINKSRADMLTVLAEITQARESTSEELKGAIMCLEREMSAKIERLADSASWGIAISVAVVGIAALRIME